MKRPSLATQNLQPPKICTAKTKKGARLLNLAPFEYGVDEGYRTLDNGSHNPVLYQLSYAHHIALTKNSNIFFVEPHLTLRQGDALKLVRMKRLELLRLAALEPKSSVSTNSTTSALEALKAKAPDV